jgi:hypothetical protein
MKNLALTLVAVFGIGMISLAHGTDVERPIKKAMKKEGVRPVKIMNPHKLKAHCRMKEKPVLKKPLKKKYILAKPLRHIKLEKK